MIPLALSNSGALTSPALLHGICAIAGFHLAEQDPANPEYCTLAIQHYKISIHLLRQSLAQPNDNPETIFATITILASIYLVVGSSSNWRIHLKGGRDFLRDQRKSFQNNSYAAIVYQLFRCLEIIGLTQDTKRTYSLSAPQNYYDNLTKEDRVNGLQEHNLRRFFGLPEAVIRALQKMHDIRYSSANPTKEEINDIESLIDEARVPDSLFTQQRGFGEMLMLHNSMAFCLAAHIQLNREFRKAPLTEVQHLVHQCTDHLETSYWIEKTARVCGVGWPLYIAACDAEDAGLRARLLHLLGKGERFGIGSVKHAEKVVRKIWERRDATGEDSPSHRQEIMNALGLDLLLA